MIGSNHNMTDINCGHNYQCSSNSTVSVTLSPNLMFKTACIAWTLGFGSNLFLNNVRSSSGRLTGYLRYIKRCYLMRANYYWRLTFSLHKDSLEKQSYWIHTIKLARHAWHQTSTLTHNDIHMATGQWHLPSDRDLSVSIEAEYIVRAPTNEVVQAPPLYHAPQFPAQYHHNKTTTTVFQIESPPIRLIPVVFMITLILDIFTSCRN